MHTLCIPEPDQQELARGCVPQTASFFSETCEESKWQVQFLDDVPLDVEQPIRNLVFVWGLTYLAGHVRADKMLPQHWKQRLQKLPLNGLHQHCTKTKTKTKTNAKWHRQ